MSTAMAERPAGRRIAFATQAAGGKDVNPVPDLESDARVLETLRTHDARESAILASYRRLVDESSNEGVRYLGRLIIEDEERHHELISEMANRIDSWIQGRSVEPSTPVLSPRVDRELLEETRRLIALERQDAKELRLLQKELRYAPATSLLPFLVKLMLQDTARHIEMLGFIRAYAG
jgi:rubrerythrin